MNVRELIRQLQQCPQDLLVAINDPETDTYYTLDDVAIRDEKYLYATNLKGRTFVELQWLFESLP